MLVKIVERMQTNEDKNYDRQYYDFFSKNRDHLGFFALTNWKSSNSIEIFDLKVKKQYRHNQIGTQIIDFLKKHFSDQIIWVFANAAVTNFYQKNGFYFCLNNQKYKYAGGKKQNQKSLSILMSLSSECLFINKITKILDVHLIK